MKSILFICNYRANVGGISGQVEILERKLKEEGYSCDIISTNGSFIKRGKAVFRILFNGAKYDIFHIHACSWGGFFPAVVGITIGRLLNRHIVLTYHGGGANAFFSRKKRFVRHFLRKTDANIALSGFIGGEFNRIGLPYVVIPNIIELDEKRFRIRSKVMPKFISIRSFAETYNIPCTLNAFIIVKRQFPQAELTLLGDGPLRQSMEQFVERNGIKDVTFIGKVDNNQIYKYLDQSDVMVSSSRLDNMPVSILEGFNAGLLVVSSKVGGVPYMIEDGVNGYLFENGDYNEMAEKMIRAISDQERFIDITEKAHKSLSYYSWPSVKEKLLSIYESA